MLVSVDITSILITYQKIKEAQKNIKNCLKLLKNILFKIKNSDPSISKLKEIIYICIQELKKIEIILIGADSFLLELLKSLYQYEGVQLKEEIISSASTPFTSQVTSGQKSILGITFKNGLNEIYSAVLQERFSKGSTICKALIVRYSSQLIVQDGNLDLSITPHYLAHSNDEDKRGLYFNSSSDLYNVKEPGTTFYHELGHMIDHALGNFNENISEQPMFNRALHQDAREIEEILAGGTLEERENFIQYLYSFQGHSVSDLLDALTDGRVQGRYVHARQYWNRPGILETEAFAHFFEASMGAREEKLAFLQHLFPHSFSLFEKLISFKE